MNKLIQYILLPFLLCNMSCTKSFQNAINIEKYTSLFNSYANSLIDLNSEAAGRSFDRKIFDDFFYSPSEKEEKIKTILEIKNNFGKVISKKKSEKYQTFYRSKIEKDNLPLYSVFEHSIIYFVEYENISTTEIFVFRAKNDEEPKIFSYVIKSVNHQGNSIFSFQIYPNKYISKFWSEEYPSLEGILNILGER
ncbi:hypothetical protein [Leptospira saintgironsiae]|uniref:Uncharacterized protein n=1 Tax=Leptospira saintgironsiae TaxID=2023183 RepID=A0A2M9Y7A4_9LEPT|nr:hypothetical protein [Leptospira saintgironsiae]PJZ47458.1 hypothetical protein CH362_19115 [Leptospira saintgironsiae]